MQNKNSPLNVIKQIQQYDFIKVIGKGSFATVYLAKKDQQYYAIKEMEITQSVVEDGRLDLFRREIEVNQKLDHQNIVKLHERIETSGYLYLVFDYCAQGDLEIYLKYQSKLPEAQAKIIFVQIVSALNELKRLNIVHRDLKLANILLQDGLQIKLADFGFAKLMPQENTLLESYCGTPLTMAPEILKNQVKYTAKCDMWSLGVILYQIVYGTTPFKTKPGGGVDELLTVILSTKVQFPMGIQISAKLKDLIQQLLQINPSQRISIEEVNKHEWISEDYKLLQIQQIKIRQIDVADKEINVDEVEYSQMIAGQIKFLISGLNKFSMEMQSLLNTQDFYQNYTIRQTMHSLLHSQFQIKINVDSVYFCHLQRHDSTLDYLLYNMCLELYQILIHLQSEKKLQCLNIIKELLTYINSDAGQKSSSLMISLSESKQIDLKVLNQAFIDKKCKLTNYSQIKQEFQCKESDWSLIQQMILDRQRLIKCQQC